MALPLGAPQRALPALSGVDPELVRLFDAYADAFGRGDAKAVAALWAFPAFFAARGRSAALDEASFRANAEALIAFYSKVGVRHFEKRVIGAEMLFEGLRLVRTADRATGSGGRALAAWEHLYLVSRTAAGLRVAAAFPDAELDAWDANGTPLGSW